MDHCSSVINTIKDLRKALQEDWLGVLFKILLLILLLSTFNSSTTVEVWESPTNSVLFPWPWTNWEIKFKNKLILENVTLSLWASRHFLTKPQKETNLHIWAVTSHIRFSLPSTHLDPHWGLVMSKSVFGESRQNVYPYKVNYTWEIRKKRWRYPFPVPYPQFKNSKGQGL